MSRGEIVPDVMTTDEKRSNTGAIANEGSRHLYISRLGICSVMMPDVHRMEYGIWDRGVFRLVWFENEQKTLFVSRDKGSERSHLL